MAAPLNRYRTAHILPITHNRSWLHCGPPATVLLDRVANGSDFDHVLLDNMAAAREGTRHLISLVHRRILLLASDPSLRNIRERIEGYRGALADADLLEFENVVVAGRNEAAEPGKRSCQCWQAPAGLRPSLP